MTDIIRDAVRAGQDHLAKSGFVTLDTIDAALQTAARHAAEAMRERAAQAIEASYAGDRLDLHPAISKVAKFASAKRAALIRAIPTEGDTNEADR